RLPSVVSLFLHAAFLAVFAIGSRFEPSLGGGLGPGDFTPVSLIDASQLPGPPPKAVTPPPAAAPEPIKEPEPEPEPPKPEPPKPKPEPEKPDEGVNVSEKAPKTTAKTPPDTVAAAPAPKPAPAKPKGPEEAAEAALQGIAETKAGREGALVAAGVEEGMEGGTGGGGGGGGGFGDFGYYRVAIQNRIGSNWSPAFVSGEAVTIVYFRVIRSGQIVGARVEKSSGIQFFDQTALRAVLASSPLPPLPAQFPEDAVGIHFRFRYKQ
ncbi:MAG TPA: energy transducer TonB, partial [Candidatus Udaeobacter sp.]|nr:energy transducer TonB [Candidatus Udaeobacter sp.]